jgi:hypothetical protein
VISTLESDAPLSDVVVNVHGVRKPVSKSPFVTVGAGVQTGWEVVDVVYTSNVVVVAATAVEVITITEVL